MFGLFRKNHIKLNLENIGVDMHSHLIPGIDDGVKSINESVRSIKLLHEAGYTHLVTTPHIMSDYYPNTPEVIMDGLEKVRLAVQKEGIPVKIDAAAEYYIDYQFYKNFDEANLLTINNRFVLFELFFF
jgi:protein-tyrosine phosphatase